MSTSRTTPQRWRLSQTVTTATGSPPGCVDAAPVTTSSLIVKDDQVSYGNNIPNYKQVIAQGGNATTSLIGTRHKLSASSAVYVQLMKRTSPYYASQACYAKRRVVGQNLTAGTFGSVNSSDGPEAVLQASSSLLSSLIDAQTQWRGTNFIAEFRETVHMLRRPLEGIHRNTWSLIRKTTSMKRLFRRNPRQYAELLGNAWLSWSFGVKPLANDVSELYRALQLMGGDLSSMDRLPIKGRGRELSTMVHYVNGASGAMSLAVHDSFTRTELSVRYDGAVKATPPGCAALRQHFGFTPEDIVPAVWEAVPWSFLIDYFVNVNEMLEGLRWASADLAWLKKTTRNTAVRVWTSHRPVPDPISLTHYVVVVRGGAAWTTATRTVRNKATPPLPAWNFKIPGSLAKWINIAALAAGIRASRPVS